MKSGEIRITFQNIRSGIKTIASNDAFVEECMSKIVHYVHINKMIDMDTITDVVRHQSSVGFEKNQLNFMERSIKFNALIDSHVYVLPDGKIH